MRQSSAAIEFLVEREALINGAILILHDTEATPHVRVLLGAEAAIEAVIDIFLALSDIFDVVVPPERGAAVFEIPLVELGRSHHRAHRILSVHAVLERGSAEVRDLLHMHLSDPAELESRDGTLAPSVECDQFFLRNSLLLSLVLVLTRLVNASAAHIFLLL